MTDLATATAAPMEIEIGDVKFQFYPLCLADYGKWDRWAKASHMRSVMDAYGQVEGVERIMAVREAHNAIGKIYFGSPQAVGLMLSIEGKLQIISLSASRIKPVTPDELWTIFCGEAGSPDFNKINEVFVEVMRISGFAPAEGSAEGNPQEAVMAMMGLL